MGRRQTIAALLLGLLVVLAYSSTAAARPMPHTIVSELHSGMEPPACSSLALPAACLPAIRCS